MEALEQVKSEILYFYIVKRAFHKISAAVMAFVLLLSTVSWTVDKHLCMGRVMDIAFFVEADDCGMESAAKLMDGEFQNHCCDDESFTIEGQDVLKLSVNDLDLEQQVFLAAFIGSYYHLFQDDPSPKLEDYEYPPPQLVKDLQLLDQVFLI
ncbi:hypothetical protein [uncultured Croceitalea sp.]|uniref:HYC_CC_PP family protein n=1 Tax=uncultured Croceitalea sp. TaxID=1798908 RepID=UPI00330631C1